MRRITAVVAALLVSLAGTVPVAAGTEEGIKVHGRWNIEILEPDGTLVSVTEFENALVDPYGVQFITFTLGSQNSAGALGVLLAEPTGSEGHCDDGGGGFERCFLTEPGSVWGFGSAHSNNLEVEVAGSLILSGSVTADQANLLGWVQTLYKICPSSVSPDDCLTYSGAIEWEFTEAILAEPVPVDAGQIIQVTVTISFS